MCLGFDGSETGDWTAIKGETVDGLLFTPRYLGFEGRPTIWNPADHGGRIPRAEVDAAIDWLHGHYEVFRGLYDPPLWGTEIDEWAVRHGNDALPKEQQPVVRFETNSVPRMHPALERFVTDLGTGKLRHDGCPITTAHVRNARMAHRRDGRYLLCKPDAARKIDVAMAGCLAHEAAAGARLLGWGADDFEHFTIGF